MNHKELIAAVAEASGDTKATVARVVDCLSTAIRLAATTGDTVAIPGVGKFGTRQAKARTMNSPIGGTVEVPAKIKPKFTAAAALKRAAEGV
jgi:DNA-binding protein HU-beta